jgi:hypothetical protein
MNLVYAAVARCDCGAGMAYREDADPYLGSWRCSAELLGETEPHSPIMPFRWNIIIPEDIPSARGETTRPYVQDDESVV